MINLFIIPALLIVVCLSPPYNENKRKQKTAFKKLIGGFYICTIQW